jgi:hypothetical protein
VRRRRRGGDARGLRAGHAGQVLERYSERLLDLVTRKLATPQKPA